MIRLNLLPPEIRRAGASLQVLEQLPWRQIASGGVALLILVSGWLLLQNGLQGKALARVRGQMEGLRLERIQLEQTEASLQSLQSRTAALNDLRAPEKQWAPRLNLFSDSIVSDLWFTFLMLRMASSSETEEFLSKEFQELGLPNFQLPPILSPEPSSQTEGGGVPSFPEPFLVLIGSAVVTSKDAAAPVTRFLQRLREHPEFSRWFKGLELKDVIHEQVRQEEVSNFIVLLYPSGP